MRRILLGMAISLAALAPQGLRADDQKIAQQIVQELKAQQAAGNLRGFKIDLAVEDGTVLLQGHVSSPEQQQLALEIARRAEGVKQVVNDLRIDGASASEKGPAPQTALSGLSKLNPWKLWSAEKPAADTTSRSTSRSVMTRPSAEARTAARSQQRNTTASSGRTEATEAPAESPAPAVQAEQSPVAAQIAAQPKPPQITDEQIARQIYDQLQQFKQSGYLHGFRLDMQVLQGTVVLEGQVPAPEQKQLALEVARRVPGVYQVVDMIRVEPPAQVAIQTVSTGESSARRRSPQVPTPVAEPTPIAQAPKTAPAPRQEATITRVAPQATAAQPVPQIPTTQPMPQAAPGAMGLQPVAPAPLAVAPGAMTAMPQPYGAYYQQPAQMGLPPAAPIATYYGNLTGSIAQVRYDHPQLPNYAWPSYAAYPNYAAVTYPRQYSPTAWPYIGPFYPYPQVPLGWRKVTLEWDDGWWQLDFKSK
jgi:osmotically-inducible protein OsmY